MTALMPKDMDIAAKIPVLSGLKPVSLAVLMTAANLVSLRPGQALFRQGEPATSFAIIVEGWIKLYRVTPAGDEVVLNVLTRGESFAEAATFLAGQYPAAASAVTRARVLTIPADHVVSCARQMPDIAIAMIAFTSHHLHWMAQRVEQLIAQSATQRVADFLISLAQCTKGPCTIPLPYDKSVIAGRLGLQPESLSRVFAKLRSVGVEVSAAHVVVNDMARLRELVANDRIQRGAHSARSPDACPGWSKADARPSRC